jgi:starch synthase
MDVLHISAECYPVAKTGGLGDVVGALPGYLNKAGVSAAVILPKYDLKWVRAHRFEPVYEGAIRLHDHYVPFRIELEADNSLAFPLYVVNIPGKFDRPGIYADPAGYTYGDEVERYLCFQQAILQWLLHAPERPALLHCHDHHTGLIPFMVKHCPEYRALSQVPTVFTIHNGMYHGAFSWRNGHLLPYYDAEARGLLDWADTVCPLAAGVRCAWRVTTVSPSYLQELTVSSNGMEWLFSNEWAKSSGILNGIDAEVWDPETDTYLEHRLTDGLEPFKAANKQFLAEHFHIDPSLPLVAFIGRLVGEKGADLLPEAITRVMDSGMRVCFLLLGTGDPRVEDQLRHLAHRFPGRVAASLQYHEGLAHLIYAGADFLLMPSRVEPCGLNQMYAMRYGTVPVVRSVGGLRDTVPDIGEPDGLGRGIRFDRFAADDLFMAIYRAADLYHQPDRLRALRQRIHTIDFSWQRSAAEYIRIYRMLTA